MSLLFWPHHTNEPDDLGMVALREVVVCHELRGNSFRVITRIDAQEKRLGVIADVDG